MGIENFSNVKRIFYEESGFERFSTKIPYILVDNFPKPGKFVALRFLEQVKENPEVVISLPTGKTPEYFIKWKQYIKLKFITKNCKNHENCY